MLPPETIQQNWNTFLSIIEDNISEPRKTNLIKMYQTYEDRIILMPASHKAEYHNSFPGGYVDHVLRVVSCALRQYELFKSHGSLCNFTEEELIFSAINHDLGKIGSPDHESYIEQDDQWRKNNLGEMYKHNTALDFMSVPDRGIYLLQHHDVKFTINEMIAIQTHDGLYDESNKKYFMGYMPEQKPRTSLPYILHFADMMASRIEFEHWFENKNKIVNNPKSTFKIDPTNKPPQNSNIKQKALSQKGNEKLKNLIDQL